ncbi:hypothetical protein AKJ47_02910 [candidate division MSBL1 archaeon SCGC-AAA261G05]|uniref:Helix-hairpin-helix DNA-binding motif class 1 domain-containing protein n=1 Tax=candidate division MSBL1 archaeon SCGC-AAA261G05 TaxID=1698276 RepID=A0A133V9H0_9EURY|nr:hypothetical protein AKJ47_02910 [candidate division MSBL1 archaeon SCGC-AAA261G05]
MNLEKDKVIGALIVIGVILAAIVYFGLMFLGFGFEVIATVVSIGFLVLLGIGGWIGWTMARTPTPEPLEDLDLEEIEAVGEEELEREVVGPEDLADELASIPGMTDTRVQALLDAGFDDSESFRSASRQELTEGG